MSIKWVVILAIVCCLTGCGDIQEYSPDLVDVTLEWYPNPEPDLAGYKLYLKETYDPEVSYTEWYVLGNVTTCLVEDLEWGRLYTFALSAYNTKGFESEFSEIRFPKNIIDKAISSDLINEFSREIK